MRFVVLVLVSGASSAFASGLGETHDAELAQIAERAGQSLLRARLPTGGWSWERKDKKEGDNFGGIVAESLLAAYEQSGRDIYLEAARDYADRLVERYRRAPSELPYKPDVEHLVRVSEVTGLPVYAEVARTWFEAVKKVSPRGSAEVQRILRGRQKSAELVGYDVALAIRAALAVEQFDYARELGDAVWSARQSWMRAKSVFGTIGRAALLDALATLDAKRYAAAIDSLAKALLREQTENGSWCANATQPTAYAVRALSRLTGDKARAAAKRGAGWLSQTLLADGSWAHFNDGLPMPFVGDLITEIQAEALTAVIVASKI
jgi:hypothetical protein